MLINNHTNASKGKTKGHLYLEDVFGFPKSFRKVTKILGFHLVLKTTDLQDCLYKSISDDKNVTINKLYLFIPNIKASVETQLMFNEATQNNYKKEIQKRGEIQNKQQYRKALNNFST